MTDVEKDKVPDVRQRANKKKMENVRTKTSTPVEDARGERSGGWRQREDVLAWAASMMFVGVLIAMVYVVGGARGWDATSGYTHNTTSSEDRFLPEPYVPEPGVRGRHGKDATGRWYYWRVPPARTTVWSHLVPWVGYTLHQLLIWAVIFSAQQAKSRQNSGQKFESKLSWFNWISIMLNMVFHLLHFVNTHTTYDGLSQDVELSTSEASVFLLLVLILTMEYRDRGLFLGWPGPQHTGSISRKLRLDQGPIDLVRRYHGYALSWAAVYTFWYHPMENTLGHALGVMYTWIILLQGSLVYTKLHLNRWWRLLQEVMTVVHGGVVAWQTGGPDLDGTRLWPMFTFGTLMCFALTQVYGLSFWRRVPGWMKALPPVLYSALVLWAYSWIPDRQGRTWVRIHEIFRIPAVFYLYFFLVFGCLKGFSALGTLLSRRKPSAGDEQGSGAGQKTQVTSANKMLLLLLVVLIYVAHMVAGIVALYADFYNTSMIGLLMRYLAIYCVGAALSFVLLNQAIPVNSQK